MFDLKTYLTDAFAALVANPPDSPFQEGYLDALVQLATFAHVPIPEELRKDPPLEQP